MNNTHDHSKPSPTVHFLAEAREGGPLWYGKALCGWDGDYEASTNIDEVTCQGCKRRHGRKTKPLPHTEFALELKRDGEWVEVVAWTIDRNVFEPEIVRVRSSFGDEVRVVKVLRLKEVEQ